MPLDESLEGWSEASRVILSRRLLGTAPTGRISPDEVTTLARAEETTVDRLMTRVLPIARRYARAPISNFYVGAVALGASGSLYLGANLEFGGNALNQSVHAEQSAVANAFGNRERGITAIAVTAAPCGHCRQFLNEITDRSSIRILVDGQPVHTLDTLLPASFGPQDLGITAGMMSRTPAALRFTSEQDDDVARAALDAASRAYAPHTKSRSGCAVTMGPGRVFAGSYLENAAFNPSLSPLQAALVHVVFAGGDFSTIDRVVLVEMKGAAISQRAATETVLAAVSPKARLDLLGALDAA